MTSRTLRLVVWIVAFFAFAAAGAFADSAPELEELGWEMREKLFLPVDRWLGEIASERNEEGARYRRGSASRTPRKVDDSTYVVTAHVQTAERDRQITERVELTVERDGKGWKVTGSETIDSHTGLFRATGMACKPFEKFSFDREGMLLSASNGSVCEAFFQGRSTYFAVHADDMSYSYVPPEHAMLVPTGHDFYAIHENAAKDHSKQLVYDPYAFTFQCDVETCDELLSSSFEGLTRVPPEERESYDYDRSVIDEWIGPYIADVLRARKDNPFAGFRPADQKGNRYFSLFLPTEMKDRDDGIGMYYDNWGVRGGWEVLFYAIPQRWDVPNQLTGPVYGYFTEETLKNEDPYELERRDDTQTRWFEVHSIKGRVDLATLDSEKVQGDVTFGLTLKQDMSELPFSIISFSSSGAVGQGRPKPITVNSIRIEGEETTYVRTGPVSGRVVLPREMKAGTKVDVRMHWESRAILKYTSSYAYMPRQGWMPFVHFGDIIDDFELTIRTPAEYDIIGIGHKIDETIEDDVRVSHWKADSPINFPTIIFGRYISDTPGKKFQAQKLDGTPIPLRVHVDKNSVVDWGIAGKKLPAIANQAVNAINLYSHISGVDYPFGELNLVNDATQFLYGQAPSSVIYLGSGVFQSEGELAPFFLDSSYPARFLRSVVAHEVGHQWWGNKIANANQRNYWFVESLAEYFSAIYLEYSHGWKDYQGKVDEWHSTIMNSTLKGSVQNSSTLFAGEWGGGRTQDPYTAAVYNKGPYAFHMLREIFKGEGPRGDQGADKKFFAFLSQFSQELAAKREIVTYDIQYAAENALGGIDPNGNRYKVDLEWFFDQWIRGSGMPQFRLQYDLRRAEDGGWIIDGNITQRVFLGQTDEVMKDTVYRGVVELSVVAKGGPYVKRYPINQATTRVQLKVPEKPLEVRLNHNGGMLALASKVNEPW